MLFDIVICYGPNYKNIINQMIEHTKKNVIGYRNIYIISYDKNIKIDGCITIDENIFPFNKKYIENYINPDRSGWYLQQLLKLYAIFVIDNILDNVLIIDCDTVFYKPTVFFENNIPLYNYGYEYNEPYFEHMKILHPSLKKMDKNKSGICHHMVFQKQILIEIFTLIESHHKKLFYEVFIENSRRDICSSASEYELYFNYLLQYVNKDLYKIRELKYINYNSNMVNNSDKDNYDYISYHWYIK